MRVGTYIINANSIAQGIFELLKRTVMTPDLKKTCFISTSSSLGWVTTEDGKQRFPPSRLPPCLGGTMAMPTSSLNLSNADDMWDQYEEMSAGHC